MFRFWASSICLLSIPLCPHRLSRAILQHIFSCLAGAQFADCITCLVNYHFVFILSIQLPFSEFTCFTYTHFLVSICLKMSCFWSSSICLFSNPVCPNRLSRAIHQHIFSRLTSAQSTDSITHLVYTHFVLVCTDYHIFANLLIICFWVWTCLYMFRFHVSRICYLSTQSWNKTLCLTPPPPACQPVQHYKLHNQTFCLSPLYKIRLPAFPSPPTHSFSTDGSQYLYWKA